MSSVWWRDKSVLYRPENDFDNVSKSEKWRDHSTLLVNGVTDEGFKFLLHIQP